MVAEEQAGIAERRPSIKEKRLAYDGKRLEIEAEKREGLMNDRRQVLDVLNALVKKLN